MTEVERARIATLRAVAGRQAEDADRIGLECAGACAALLDELDEATTLAEVEALAKQIRFEIQPRRSQVQDRRLTEKPYECERMSEARAEGSHEIGEFIEWLEGNGMQICEMDDSDRYWPVGMSIEKLLAKYFGIDLDRVEAERREVLNALAAANAERVA